METNQPVNIAVFASGAGTNAENIIRYLNRPGSPVRVALVVTNRPGAGVIGRAIALGVPVEVMGRDSIASDVEMLPLLQRHSVRAIALAGFLLMVPSFLISAYPVVNIHPSLLPKFGGKGMYGSNVHKAVIDAGERESGITIHHVTEEYDKGRIIFQASVPVEPGDTPESLEQKVHQLEWTHYPRVIESTFAGIRLC